jgi:hypothetical protein
MPNLATLSRQELENNLTQLAAHINAATYQFLRSLVELEMWNIPGRGPGEGSGG